MRAIAEEDINIKAIAAKRKAKQVKARGIIDKELGQGTYRTAMAKVDDISNSKNPVIELLAYTKKCLVLKPLMLILVKKVKQLHWCWLVLY